MPVETLEIPQQLDFAAAMAATMASFHSGTAHAIAAEHEREIQPVHLTATEVSKQFTVVTLPPRLAPLRVAANRPPEIDAVVSGLQHQLNAMQASYQGQLNALQANIKHETKDSFRTKMEALRAQSKADSDRAVDQAYAQLTKIGAAHPESRTLIAEAAQAVSQLQVIAVKTIANSINSALSLGLDAIDKVANAVKNAAETVGHALESAGKAIGHIFSGW